MKQVRMLLVVMLSTCVVLSFSACGDDKPSDDRDGDGVLDAVDNCPDVANADQADRDSDGVGNVCDNCPDHPNADQLDSDGNGTGDACEPGLDSDGDGIPNTEDNCPNDPNPEQGDTDNDDIGNVCDNCPDKHNPDQADSDGDGEGDACEPDLDSDGDGVPNADDNCPDDPNADQADADGDTIGDVCDNCPDHPNTDQTDSDSNGVGDACEPGLDSDGDGIPNDEDNCPNTPNQDQLDGDGDEVGDRCDNCPDDVNPNQADTDGDGIGDACEVTLTLLDMFPPAGWREATIAFTLSGLAIQDGVTVVFTHSDDANTTFTPTGLTVDGTTTINGTIPADPARMLGLYDITATNPNGETDTLEKGFLVSPNPPPTIEDVIPPFAWNGDPQDGVLSDRAITIRGTGFLSTPGVRWVSRTDANLIWEATSVAFTDSTSLTAIVPSESGRMPAGDYTVQVTNPDLQAAEWAGTFEIVATPPPRIMAIDPIRAPGNDFGTGAIPLTVTGQNFVAGAGGSVVSLLGPAGEIPLTTDAQSDTTLVAVPGGVSPANGGYPVKVTNPDGQWDVYYLFSLTSSSEGHLADNWGEHFESTLAEPRWMHGATYGFDIYGSGYIYAAGGTGSAGTALDSVEYAQVSVYGVPGVWRFAEQFDEASGTHVANTLTFPRTGVAVAHIGPYIYAVGGSSDGIDALATTEVAKILGIDTIPYLNRHPAASPVGSLPVGSWYYRVSAVTPTGEGLPSQEAIARNEGGALTIRWAAVHDALSYNIYRTVASDGRSQTERLLATGVDGTSFTDNGEDALAPAPGNLRGYGSAGGTLAPGLWTYRVSAIVSVGETVAGYPLYSEVGLGEGSIELNWDEVPGATGYNIYRTETVDDGTGVTYLLANTANLAYTDDGTDSVDTNTPAPDGILPLPPGSLTRWRVLEDDQGAPILLHSAREGGRAIIISVPWDDDDDPDTPAKRKAFLYAAGGRVDSSFDAPHLDTIERAELSLLDGGISAWELEPETFNFPRAFYALLTSQGRTENPTPGDDPPQQCDDVDGDGYDDWECGGTDCDDTDASIHPGAEEICDDGIDQDCDGQDAACACLTDEDDDGFISEADCGGTDCCDTGTEGGLGCAPETAADIHPGAEDICEDGIDSDCDDIDPACDCWDNDSDGYDDFACGGTDCDDSDPNINPGAEEICGDGIDQNCDMIDPGCGCQDADGDGYEAEECGGTDCDDTDPTIHPGAYDWCGDGIDQNCDNFDPTCRRTRQSEDEIYLIATKGDDVTVSNNRNGLGSSEICVVNEDPAAGPLGQLSPWALQPAADTQDFWGHEALLYFDFVFNFAGTSDHTIGDLPRSTTQVERFEFDPLAANMADVMCCYQSSSKTLTSQRAYFSLTRIFSALIAVGGANRDGIVDYAESTRQ